MMGNQLDPERALALSYAARGARDGLAALFSLDYTLAQILRTTREPLVGQMRLTWWHEALTALDTVPAPAQPVLQALAAEVLPCGVSGLQLSGMIDGWEALLEADPIDDAALLLHAKERGTALFAAAGLLLGCGRDDPLAEAGAAWALIDLARHVRDVGVARRAVVLAEGSIATATSRKWSRGGRALGALAQIARMDSVAPLDLPIARGAPRRVARMALHRITGR